MIPLRDTNRTLRTPYVNLLLILVNLLVFAYELWLLSQGSTVMNNFIYDWGMVHSRIVTEHGIHDAATLVTSMFIHGGWAHVIFNMWFLYVFGDNIEDRMGHLGYLLFYFLCGMGGNLADFFSDPYRSVPSIGASGAISGVMGAYFVLFPDAKILTINPFGWIGFLWKRSIFVNISTIWFLGYFFFIQCFAGIASLDPLAQETEGGGVAVWAHIGGFVCGIVAMLLPRDVEDELQQEAEQADTAGRYFRAPETNVPVWYYAVMVCLILSMVGTMVYKIGTTDESLANHQEDMAKIAGVSVVPHVKLAAAMSSHKRIKSATSVYSLGLASDQSLWFFNDALLAETRKRKPSESAPLANVAALISIPCDRLPVRSFTGSSKTGAEPFLKPIDKDKFYSVLDSVLVRGKLYVFALRQSRSANHDLSGNLDGVDLIVVSNPEKPPTSWMLHRQVLTRGAKLPFPGIACHIEAQYLYICLGVPTSKTGVFQASLARLPWEDLSRTDFSRLEYFCNHSQRTSLPSWMRTPDGLVKMFDYSGPAMSISHVDGMRGFVAVSAAADGSGVVLRRAKLLEGPWSTPYIVPALTANSQGRTYLSAQNHPELVSGPREMAITYVERIATKAPARQPLAPARHHAPYVALTTAASTSPGTDNVKLEFALLSIEVPHRK